MLLALETKGAKPFGRFGYSSTPILPGFVITKDSFRAEHDRASVFVFGARPHQWKATEVSDINATYAIAGGGVDKARVSLTAPGFELHFPKEFRLQVRSLEAPFLTWASGSVEMGTPSAPGNWIVVSFTDKQPPILIAFPEGGPSLIVEGSTGRYVIRSEGLWNGWARVALPMGVKGYSGQSAGDFGTLASAVLAHARFWTQPAPKILGRTIETYPGRIRAKWKFDRAGAIVPPTVLLCGMGGYSVTARSTATSVDAPTMGGPLAYTNEANLILDFPIQSLPRGIGLCLGAAPTYIPKERQWLSVSSVAELAIERMAAGSPASLEKDAERTRVKFLQEIPRGTEPNSGQSVLYSPDGGFIDLLAAQALLAEVAATAQNMPGSNAPFLMQIRMKRDWLTWLPVAEDHDISRRAATFAAISSFLRPEAEWRLTGAMFQAGLAADRGLAQWRTSKGFQQKTPRLIEALESLRNGLYSGKPTGLATNWLSPVRVFGVSEVSAEQSPEGLAITWRPESAVGSDWALVAPFGLQLIGCKGVKSAVFGTYEGIQFLCSVPSEAFAPVKANFRVRGNLSVMPRLVPFTSYVEVQR